ncbi:uncharacterized protein LODBEIA_P59520 [Lodderomyces beijingensis]|uniref:F-box domain-containing protein n=1 Tax=Lodderomyces beijingensis TaxID=1775926 RepID=A0ABP0ZUA8_9ASCO
MSILPLDLVLHIVDVGGLDLKDCFALYQTNQLFRQNLSHPYFWHVIYQKQIAPIFDELEIPRPVTNYFEECHLHYKRKLELDQHMQSSRKIDTSKLEDEVRKTDLQLLAMEFAWDRDTSLCYMSDPTYILALLQKHQAEEQKLWHFLENGRESSYDITKVSLLEYLVMNQFYAVGLRHMKNLNNDTSHESILFYFSLLERSNFRLLRYRLKYLTKLKKIIRNRVLPKIAHQAGSVSNVELRRKYLHASILELMKSLSGEICRGQGSTPIDAYDVLKLYCGMGGSEPVILAVIAKVVEEEWHFLCQSLHLCQNQHPQYKFSVRIVSNLAMIDDFIMLFGPDEPLVIEHHNNPTLMGAFLNYRKTVHSWFMPENAPSRFAQLFSQSRQLPDWSTTKQGFTSYEFSRRVKLFPDDPNAVAANFIPTLLSVRNNESLTHKIVLNTFASQEDTPINTRGERGYSCGVIVNTRMYPGVIYGEENDGTYFFLLCVDGGDLLWKTSSMSPWRAKDKDEIGSMIRLLGLDGLFMNGFRTILFDRSHLAIKFEL